MCKLNFREKDKPEHLCERTRVCDVYIDDDDDEDIRAYVLEYDKLAEMPIGWRFGDFSAVSITNGYPDGPFIAEDAPDWYVDDYEFFASTMAEAELRDAVVKHYERRGRAVAESESENHTHIIVATDPREDPDGYAQNLADWCNGHVYAMITYQWHDAGTDCEGFACGDWEQVEFHGDLYDEWWPANPENVLDYYSYVFR